MMCFEDSILRRYKRRIAAAAAAANADQQQPEEASSGSKLHDGSTTSRWPTTVGCRRAHGGCLAYLLTVTNSAVRRLRQARNGRTAEKIRERYLTSMYPSISRTSDGRTNATVMQRSPRGWARSISDKFWHHVGSKRAGIAMVREALFPFLPGFVSARLRPD